GLGHVALVAERRDLAHPEALDLHHLVQEGRREDAGLGDKGHGPSTDDGDLDERGQEAARGVDQAVAVRTPDAGPTIAYRRDHFILELPPFRTDLGKARGLD